MNTLPTGHFTLQQLTNIALGGECITGVNTIVLHSLLNLVLKKLNCQNERVSISGYEAKQIAELLQTAKISPISFSEQKFDTILERFNNLDELEKRLNEAEENLKQHLLGIRRYLSKLESLEPCRFDEDEYYELCEDLCSTLDPDVKEACDALRQSFLKKILLRMCHPMVKAYFAVDNKLSTLESEICSLTQRLDNTFNAYSAIESVELELGWCRIEFERLHTSFIKALNEIQDILDAKVNKYQMLQLKIYITDRLDIIYEQLNKLFSEGRCQRACAIVLENAKTKSTTKQKQKSQCECEGVHYYASREQKLLERIKRIDIKRIEVLLETQGRKSWYLPT